MEPCEIGTWKHHEKQHDHDSRFIRARIFLLLFGVASSDCPTPVSAQSIVPGDVKNGTPGQIMKLEESLHVEAR